MSTNEYFEFELTDFYLTDLAKYAKKNIDIPSKTTVDSVIDTNIEIINKKTISHPITVKEKEVVITEADSEDDTEEEVSAPEAKEEKEGLEQISIFDDLDE